jgi:gas vesicle protein
MAKAGKISLLIGVITGAVTGLLFAPQRGKELRQNISKERQAGGLGYRALAQDISKMGTELSAILSRVAQSEEAKRFWLKTQETVGELSGGSVELDRWAQQAQQKITQLNRAVTQYAQERKKYITGVRSVASKAMGAVRKTAKKAKKRTVTKATKATKKPVTKKKGKARSAKKK